jgi:methyl-accepting chemotaxis protein/methyl-accepting chemotaxis protein-1 (serine sensor receptor)
VVADEVRNLAQRSAVAARDTAELIEEAITNSNQGAHRLEQVATAIRAITDSAGKVKSLVDEVNEASRQQTEGIAQVATAVTQVSTVTQTAAASAEESAAAAQELRAQSQTVSELVHELEALTGATLTGATLTGATLTGATLTGATTKYAGPMVRREPVRLPVVPAKKAEDPFPLDNNSSFHNF